LKILVVDDHPLIRQALQNVLHQLDATVQILEAADCARALDLAAAHTDLDIILLDLYLPGMGGLDVLSLLRERYPGLPVVVLSASNDRETVLGAIEKGAMGFIPKSSSNEVMLSALRLVMSGGIYLPPEILGNHSAAIDISVATSSAPSPTRSPTDLGLTERQLQVLALMVQGKSNKLISRELNLAEGTVKIHVSAILKALNVTSRTQAVVTISRLGLKLDGLTTETGATRPA
jgi:DNA-binding NarL/FixJ family response regulator